MNLFDIEFRFDTCTTVREIDTVCVVIIVVVVVVQIEFQVLKKRNPRTINTSTPYINQHCF